MTIKDLDNGEKFKYNNRIFTKLKKVPRHDNAYDCMDDEGRHRPFRGDVDVWPCQSRLDSDTVEMSIEEALLY